MANESYSLQGGVELAQQLRDTPGKLSIIAVRRGGLAAAKPILDAARRYAPDPDAPAYYTDSKGKTREKERTGRLQEFLNRGSRYVAKDQTVRIFVGLIKMHVAKARKLGLTRETRRGRNGRFLPGGQTRTVVNDAWYGKFPEKGTKYQPAQHFLSRAIRENAKAFLDAFTPSVRQEIAKAAIAAKRPTRVRKAS